jgi:hypothetical protein
MNEKQILNLSIQPVEKVIPPPQPPPLGRLYKPDPRDRRYAVTPAVLRKIPVAPVALRKHAWRYPRPVLDQGPTSRCVVFSLAISLQSAPKVHKFGWPDAKFTDLYDRARAHDGFPMPHDGTTMRAACDVAIQDGLISQYLHIYDEDTLREYLATRGTVGAGQDWFREMYFPSKKGAYIEPEGSLEGGHETVCRWYYGPKHYKYPDTYEFWNPWGEQWGDRGIYRMKADSFRWLIWGLNGDLVIPTEMEVVKPAALPKAA